MIVASHQPNFMPYMGYFYKMYMCDVFTLSDTVQFSRQGFHNYNFVMTEGERAKITVPVSQHNGIINQVQLSQWEHHKRKIMQRLSTDYCHAPYFRGYKDVFELILNKDYTYLYELNLGLIKLVHTLFGFDCKLVLESDLGIVGDTATDQIADICKKTGCDVYLSGSGAQAYLDEAKLREARIRVAWSNYKPLDCDSGQLNLSVFDYIVKNGAVIPDEWKKEKEARLYG